MGALKKPVGSHDELLARANNSEMSFLIRGKEASEDLGSLWPLFKNITSGNRKARFRAGPLRIRGFRTGLQNSRRPPFNNVIRRVLCSFSFLLPKRSMLLDLLPLSTLLGNLVVLSNSGLSRLNFQGLTLLSLLSFPRSSFSTSLAARAVLFSAAAAQTTFFFNSASFCKALLLSKASLIAGSISLFSYKEKRELESIQNQKY